MAERILVDAGPRTGRTFRHESRLRAALAEGKEPIVTNAGVWFRFSLSEDDVAVYWPFEHRPEGI